MAADQIICCCCIRVRNHTTNVGLTSVAINKILRIQFDYIYSVLNVEVDKARIIRTHKYDKPTIKGPYPLERRRKTHVHKAKQPLKPSSKLNLRVFW